MNRGYPEGTGLLPRTGTVSLSRQACRPPKSAERRHKKDGSTGKQSDLGKVRKASETLAIPQAEPLVCEPKAT